ncbi:hypothetical protein H5410_001750 [Solanum commersonii]|uniref:Uncharacterized protein n=1 Tax=Solanum commersonii TaxID=4109 RepID=A0A9J6B014_SOLCO|nr:hypothetical protein H5410_001750 [Solanum commersonii]
MLAFSIFTFWTIGRYSTSSWNNSAKHSDCFFHRLFDPLPSGHRILEQRAESVLLADHQRFLAILMLQLLRYFQPFLFLFASQFPCFH